MVIRSSTMLRARMPNNAARTPFDAVRMFRRSWRSMNTPAGNESTNQGNIAAALTVAMRRVSLVSDSAKSGAAAATIPSPRFDDIDAAK